VGLERGFVLHSDDYDSPGSTVPISEGICLTATEDILTAIASDDAPEQCVLALGYAGWDAGQLEEELAENVWLVSSVSTDIVYDLAYDTKWSRGLACLGITADQLQPGAGHA
jgi:putative transcriptional regulator